MSKQDLKLVASGRTRVYLNQHLAEIQLLSRSPLADEVTLIAATRVLEGVWTALEDQNADPEPVLSQAIADARAIFRACEPLFKHVTTVDLPRVQNIDEVTLARELFEAAWTSYDAATYDHSIELMKARLLANGFGEEWLSGKQCFDGGCGTGRLSIAMSELGADHVVAADFGRQSLEFCQMQLARRNIKNVETREMNVCDLSAIPDKSFDLVASHGVLHHTTSPERGICEHFRITKSGGTFWLYLYGRGGLIWDVFDALRPAMRRIGPTKIRERLLALGFRRGLVYSFIDNFLSPRVYFSRQQVIDILRTSGLGPFGSVLMRGQSPIDDPAKSLATTFGAKLYGPDGEIRLLIKRK